MRGFYPIKHRLFTTLTLVMLTVAVFNVHSAYASSQKPDLTVTGINIPSNITEGNSVEVQANIKNVGSGNVSGNIEVALYVDGNTNPVSIYSIPTGLHADGEKIAYLQWIAEVGGHVLRVTVDYLNNIIEENETNNDLSRLVEASSAPFDLAVSNVDVPSTWVKVNDTVLINVTVKNMGHRVSKKVDVKITIDGYSDLYYLDENLSTNVERTVSFTWKPQHPGLYHVNTAVDSLGKINESNEKNNFLNEQVLVIDDFPWWNNSWHYRLLVATQNNGMVSHSFNFTQLLYTLGLFDVEFDNNSIRVVPYSETGEIFDVTSYMFNESGGYNSIGNAIGELTWLANSVFSMIYFDVKENGEKNNTEKHIEETSNTYLSYIGEPEGWNTLIVKPKNNALILPNTTTMFEVKSDAKLSEVKGLASSGNTTLLFNFNTIDGVTWYSNQSFTEEGEYTLITTAYDEAGYIYKDSCMFKVGKLDLSIKELSFSSTKVFKNTPVDIECVVKSTASVNNVTLYVYVNGSVLTNETMSFEDALEKTFVFSWTSTVEGKVNISVYVDPNNTVPEKNELNNMINSVVTVNLPPDIMIKKMSVSSPVKEGTTAYVYAELEATGLSAATSCKVYLYASQAIMRWQSSERVYMKNVTLSPNKPFNVTLFWNPALYGSAEENGRWIIGAEVVPVSSQQDLNFSNNRRNTFLTVTPEERNPPSISNVWCEPTTVEVGGDVTTYAEVTDDTGVYNVTLIITKPNNETERYLMKFDKTKGRWYHTLTSFKNSGVYTYSVTAVDSSYLRNRCTSNNATFLVTEDHTPPELIDVWLTPERAQIKGNEIQIYAILYDNVGIKWVNVTIVDPNGGKTENTMEKVEENTYRFSETLNLLGRYTFYVSASDLAGNMKYSELHDFWATENLNDTDNDHIPDWWEERYGFDPYNPMDAKGDEDGDGYNELTEYNEGLDPLQPDTVFGFSQNELTVISAVLILFILVIVLSLVAIRRS